MVNKIAGMTGIKLFAVCFLVLLLVFQGILLTKAENTITETLSMASQDKAQRINPILPSGKVLAAKFAVPKGTMTALTFPTLASWFGVDGSFDFRLYRWNASYGETLKTQPVYAVKVEGHVDGEDVVIRFDTALESDRYLWTITNSQAVDASGKKTYGISPWRSAPAEGAEVTCYEDGMKLDSYYIFTIDTEYKASDPVLPPEEDGQEEERYEVIKLYGGSFTAPIIPSNKELAQKFAVNKGSLLSLVFENLPTWNTKINSFQLDLYRWDGDYDSTVEAEPVYSNLFENREDSQSLTIDFDTPLPAGRYLWVITDSVSERPDGGMGYGVSPWTTTEQGPDGTVCFVDGMELDEGSYRVSVKISYRDSDPEIDPEVTEEPVVTPTPERPENTEPTNTPVNTATSAPAASDGKFPFVWIAVAVVVILAGAIAVSFIVKRKRSR